jgi:hypothetical protein
MGKNNVSGKTICQECPVYWFPRFVFFRFQVAGFSAFADVACEVTDKESFNNVKHWVQEGRSDQNLDLEDF